MINGLPERLRNSRIKQGYSQRTVAKQLGISPSVISCYESGERTPSTDVLLALSYMYKCSTDYLLGRESDPPRLFLDAEGLSPRQMQAINELISSIKEGNT